jgi:nucleoside 2-deoxyribosyltransferase
MKTCFIVAPIGELDSIVRKRSDQVLRHIIRPALDACGYESVRADEISDPGNITSQILTRLTESDLVVADLTGHNPNVYYELGIRHASGKPIIHLIEQGDRIPFDLAAFRTIVLDHKDLDSAERARANLVKAIKAIDADPAAFRGLVEVATELGRKKQRQAVPIRAYLADDDPKKAEQFAKAIALFKEALDLVVVDDPPAESGSWWKRWLTTTRDLASQPEVAERLRKAERALEMQTLHKVQSEVDKNQAEAAQALIASLAGIDNAAIQVGSLLIVKTTTEKGPKLAVRTLTQNQLSLLEKNSDLFKQPEEIIRLLSEGTEPPQDRLAHISEADNSA